MRPAVLDHPAWPLVRPYVRVAEGRDNVDVLQPPDDVRAAALAAEVPCAACGAPIRCFRVRAKSERARVAGAPEERRLFYAGTCPSESNPGCSRTRAAKDHKAALIRELVGQREAGGGVTVDFLDAFGAVLAQVVARREVVGPVILSTIPGTVSIVVRPGEP